MDVVGEFLGYFAGANILMEYVLSNAAVSRSFTEYLSFAFGENDPNVWRVEVHGLPKDYNMLDFPAVALILLLTLCLCHRFGPFHTFSFSCLGVTKSWNICVCVCVVCYLFTLA